MTTPDASADDVQQSLDDQVRRQTIRLADHMRDLADRLLKRSRAPLYASAGDRLGDRPLHTSFVADVLGDLRTWAGNAAMVEQLVLDARTAERNYMEDSALRNRLDQTRASLHGAEREIDRLRARIDELDNESLRMVEQAGEMAEEIEQLRGRPNEPLSYQGGTDADA